MSREEMVRAMLFVGLVSSVYVLEAGLWCRYFWVRIKKTGNPRRALSGKLAWSIHGLAVIGILCMAYGYWIEPYWIEIKRIELHSPKLKDVSFRIVQFSDTHCDRKIRNEKRVVEMINSLHPDVIVFTGDSINTIEALPHFQEMLRSMNATLGKFAVHGNYDTHFWRSTDLFAGTGFDLAEDKVNTVSKQGVPITISGISRENEWAFERNPRRLDPDKFNVFLYHTPALADISVQAHFDLYLAGHTHGGQIALPFYGAIITLSPKGKKYESGMYGLTSNSYTRLRTPLCEYGPIESVVYVNRGIGLEGWVAPRVRFCARPEITVFDLGPSTHPESISTSTGSSGGAGPS
jgi:uncharacterized protein